MVTHTTAVANPRPAMSVMSGATATIGMLRNVMASGSSARSMALDVTNTAASPTASTVATPMPTTVSHSVTRA